MKMLTDALSGGDAFWLTDSNDADGPVGVAYCEPERMTDQTWNLQLIAVHPKGRGKAVNCCAMSKQR